MATTWVDFKQLKADIGIEQILAQYGVHLRRITATELRGRCPLSTHTSSRSRDSFSVNLARNVWSCRSQSCMQARGGRPGGNVLDFVALMESCSVRDAALWLQHRSGTLPPRPIVTETSAAELNAPLRFTLQHIDQRHPYLAMRGLTAETIRTFGVGCYDGRGFLRGRIVIPIHDEYGTLIAYVGRAIGSKEPKYRFPAGFKKSRVLFNLHRARVTGTREVVVVEGFFDSFAVQQAGYPAVVALMGSTLSRCQADLLATYFDRAILMLDGDDAGRQGTSAITSLLTGRIGVTLVTLHGGAQPDQLTAGDIQELVRPPTSTPTGEGR
jgi:DNA primase